MDSIQDGRRARHTPKVRTYRKQVGTAKQESAKPAPRRGVLLRAQAGNPSKAQSQPHGYCPTYA